MAFNPGGGGGLSGATDVALSAPGANHALTYDTSTAKWKNQPLIDSPISTATQTALNAKPSVVVMTQTEYNALAVKNASTLYVISGV